MIEGQLDLSSSKVGVTVQDSDKVLYTANKTFKVSGTKL